MKRQISMAGMVAVCLCLLASISRPARAGVFSSIQFDQGVYTLFGGEFSQPYNVVSNTLPIHNTVSVNNYYGASISATYNVTDNGSVATLDITTTASLTAIDDAAEEGGGGNRTSFTFSQPVSYTAVFSETGYGEASVNTLEINAPFISDTTETFSGTAPPGYNFLFDEGFGLSTYAIGSPADEVGSDSIAFTFTAIPEPSSVSLMAIGGAAALSRRKRRL